MLPLLLYEIFEAEQVAVDNLVVLIYTVSHRIWYMDFCSFRDNLQLLRQRYYYATWKADGTRYMMLITMDGCFLIDRSFNFRRVQMRFPCKHTNDVRPQFLTESSMI